MSRLFIIALLNILYLSYANSTELDLQLTDNNSDNKKVILAIISEPIEEVEKLLAKYNLAVAEYKNQSDETIAAQKFSKCLAEKLYCLLVTFDKLAGIYESFGNKEGALTLKKMVRAGNIDLNMLPSPNKILFHSRL